MDGMKFKTKKVKHGCLKDAHVIKKRVFLFFWITCKYTGALRYSDGAVVMTSNRKLFTDYDSANFAAKCLNNQHELVDDFPLY